MTSKLPKISQSTPHSPTDLRFPIAEPPPIQLHISTSNSNNNVSINYTTDAIVNDQKQSNTPPFTNLTKIKTKTKKAHKHRKYQTRQRQRSTRRKNTSPTVSSQNTLMINTNVKNLEFENSDIMTTPDFRPLPAPFPNVICIADTSTSLVTTPSILAPTASFPKCYSSLNTAEESSHRRNPSNSSLKSNESDSLSDSINSDSASISGSHSRHSATRKYRPRTRLTSPKRMKYRTEKRARHDSSSVSVSYSDMLENMYIPPSSTSTHRHSSSLSRHYRQSHSTSNRKNSQSHSHSHPLIHGMKTTRRHSYQQYRMHMLIEGFVREFSIIFHLDIPAEIIYMFKQFLLEQHRIHEELLLFKSRSNSNYSIFGRRSARFAMSQQMMSDTDTDTSDDEVTFAMYMCNMTHQINWKCHVFDLKSGSFNVNANLNLGSGLNSNVRSRINKQQIEKEAQAIYPHLERKLSMLDDNWILKFAGFCVAKDIVLPPVVKSEITGLMRNHQRYLQSVTTSPGSSSNSNSNRNTASELFRRRKRDILTKYTVVFKGGGTGIDQSRGGRGWSNYMSSVVFDESQLGDNGSETCVAFNWDLPQLSYRTGGNALVYSHQYGLLSVGGYNSNRVSQLLFNSGSVTTPYMKLSEEWQWQPMPPMNHCRWIPSAVFIEDFNQIRINCMRANEKLVVIGGTNSKSSLTLTKPGRLKDRNTNANANNPSCKTQFSVEIFDFAREQWSPLAETTFPRRNSGVYFDPLYTQRIYVGGGDYANQKVEMFDIHKNTWYVLGDTQLSHGFNPVLWKDGKNQLYIASTYADGVEKFDLRDSRHQWQIMYGYSRKSSVASYNKSSFNDFFNSNHQPTCLQDLFGAVIGSGISKTNFRICR